MTGRWLTVVVGNDIPNKGGCSSFRIQVTDLKTKLTEIVETICSALNQSEYEVDELTLVRTNGKNVIYELGYDGNIYINGESTVTLAGPDSEYFN